MNHLYRELAPISTAAWNELSAEATRTLKAYLAARRLVDFSGPHGWSYSSVSHGRITKSESLAAGVETSVRQVQPLIEICVPFELMRSEIEAINRGAKDPDLAPLVQAARAVALAEDRAVFHSYDTANMVGIFKACDKSSLKITEDYEAYPRVVAEAIALLREKGVDGPYAIALGPKCFTGLTETTSKGYPVIEHVRREIAGGPIVWAAALEGAMVLSLRGGDFELTIGQDFSLGYISHTDAVVKLYIRESFTFSVLTAEAAIPLEYESKA